MTAYIKYCGGCNETYSRTKAVEKIKDLFQDRIDFRWHDGKPCDVGIVVMGCDRECIRREDLAQCRELIAITSPQAVEQAIERLRRLL